MTSMRAKRARRGLGASGALVGNLVRALPSAGCLEVKHEVLTNQSLGRELPVDEKQSAATLPVSVSRWPRVQRFVRSFLDNRRHLGIVTALRAAWIVVNA